MWFRWSLNPLRRLHPSLHVSATCAPFGAPRRPRGRVQANGRRRFASRSMSSRCCAPQLGRRSWRQELVAIGSATDPYQAGGGGVPADARMPRGPSSPPGLPVSITTRRPPHRPRRRPCLPRLARRVPGHGVRQAVPTLDPSPAVATTEPGTAPPRQRLRARRAASWVRASARGVLMAPILPGISDGAPSSSPTWARRRRRGGSGLPRRPAP